jgi:hypothetical protein
MGVYGADRMCLPVGHLFFSATDHDRYAMFTVRTVLTVVYRSDLPRYSLTVHRRYDLPIPVLYLSYRTSTCVPVDYRYPTNTCSISIPHAIACNKTCLSGVGLVVAYFLTTQVGLIFTVRCNLSLVAVIRVDPMPCNT